MKSSYIEGLGHSATRIITSSFVVVDKHSRKTNRGKTYVSLVLSDRTGQVEARIWNNAEHAFRCFESGNIVEIVAKIEYYDDKLQLIVERFRRCDPSGLDLADYPPGTTGAPDDFSTLKEFPTAVGQWVSCDVSTQVKLATEESMRAFVAKYSGPTPTDPPATNKKHRPSITSSPNASRVPAASAEKLEELKRKYLSAEQGPDDF